MFLELNSSASFVGLLRTNFSTMNCLFIVAAVLGWLQQSNAELSAVGNCTFMQYYCNVREYETCFFKRLYKDPTADCGLQFWILYYKVLRENEKCGTTNDHMKSLEAAKIREIQTLYCNGLDLERPLMLSLSPCSDKHKQEVIGCINDFTRTFSTSFSQPSLCRKRDKAKQCTIFAWWTHCNQSDVADGILKKVIGSFNPFCDRDKDPLAEQTDQCENYSKPLDDEGCPLSSTTAPGSSDDDDDDDDDDGDDDDNGGLSGGAIAGIVVGVVAGVIILVLIIWCICRECDCDGLRKLQTERPVGRCTRVKGHLVKKNDRLQNRRIQAGPKKPKQKSI